MNERIWFLLTVLGCAGGLWLYAVTHIAWLSVVALFVYIIAISSRLPKYEEEKETEK